MKKLIPVFFLVALGFMSCEKKENYFTIKKQQVGKITDSTTIAQMKELYKTDSIVKKSEGQSAFESYDEYTIYNKKTKNALLIVLPKKVGDEQSLIKQIEIVSDLFKTEKGVGLSSDFGAFRKNHKVSRTEETFKSIVVFFDEINATINFSKDVLPLNVRNDRSIKIDEILIPDQSKIKNFFVFFE